MTPELVTIALGAAMLGALVLYALLGGADYGGGVWDLLAFGPRREQQRERIEKAIGPVWEANHVWLILVVVILFNGFPTAYALVSTHLNVPLTALLVAIVLRGAAFTFRAYSPEQASARRRWGWVFSIASVAGPILLGMIVGVLCSGGVDAGRSEIRLSTSGPWLAPFPIAVGLLTVSLFALLAATYLTVESENDRPLADDFRARALGAGVAVGVTALAAFLLAKSAAPLVHQGLVARWWSWPLHAITALAAVGAFLTLWTRRYRLARMLVAVQSTFIVLGWGASQYPYLVVPDVTLMSAAAPPISQRLLLYALIAGSVVLFPSLWYMFQVFKAPEPER